jgi:FkbM family methyltransferase
MIRFLKTSINYYKLRRYARHFAAFPSPNQLELIMNWLYFFTLPTIRTVYDIGAAEGQFSAACAKLKNTSRVIAFEPVPAAAEHIRTLSSKAKKITAVEVALGSSSGSVPFFLTSDGHSSSLLRPAETLSQFFPGREFDSTISVRRDTLDGVVAEEVLPLPDILKLDTQGYELEVLKGATRCLERAAFCVVECSYMRTYEDAPLIWDVCAFFAQAGWLNVGTSPSLNGPDSKPVQVDLVFASKRGIAEMRS